MEQNKNLFISSFSMLKLFLRKTLVFLGLLCAVYLAVLSMANGFTDPFYKRFTSKRQTNLILGTSRVAQGIQPTILGETLGKQFFNFSFTLNHSPYGPTYLKAIDEKLDKKSKDGIFIIGVDPWALAIKKVEEMNPEVLPEDKLVLGKLNFFNCNPNFEYLLFCLEDNQFTTLTKQFANSILFNFKEKENRWPYKWASKNIRKSIDLQTKLYLHDNGWLEVDVTSDSIILQKKLKVKIKEYKEQILPHHEFSEFRLQYLLKTISLLKEYGKVYLVRLPVHAEMQKIDSLLAPDFNKLIQPAIGLSNGYLDLSMLHSGLEYTDGNHLSRTSGQLISRQIGVWLAKKGN